MSSLEIKLVCAAAIPRCPDSAADGATCRCSRLLPRQPGIVFSAQRVRPKITDGQVAAVGR
ncbi:hypothetical protein J7370_07815 [Xanthomonas sp. D-93]|uniref:hypothetical protein n=1 Tax=Xanthomonas sp. D-93 TaxID=2821272 RepID=UPI001ADBCC29|nr:hypothetical protein [Xanthomonas sp. D-93]MBO9873300.1 hypothetical protein [Xanthomonas sp. D-93]